MIDLYTAGTGNGRRPALMLEECGLAYTTHKLDFAKGENRTESFLRINPVGAIPAIVDHDGPGGRTVTLAQSGAILLYLADKTGRFLPQDPVDRARHMQWLMLALTDLAPASGVIFQTSTRLKDPAATGFFEQRLVGMFGNVDRRLAEAEYLAGEYGLADMALYPVYDSRRPLLDAAGLGNVKRWADTLAARPAIQRGMAVA